MVTARPWLKHRPQNLWVAYSPEGIPLGTLNGSELAHELQRYIDGIASGSEHCMQFPPELEYNGVRAVFKRSSVPKHDDTGHGLEVG